MTTFLETEEGGFVNTKLVRSVVVGDEKCTAYMEGDREIKLADVYSYRIQTLRNALNGTTIFPASPGFERLQSWFDKGVAYFDSYPIIGWEVNEFGTVDPVTPKMDSENRNGWSLNGASGVKLPDGRVETLYETFENEEAWKAKMRESAAEEKFREQDKIKKVEVKA